MTSCERCGCGTDTLTGSWFNTQMICPSCERDESKHPDFARAKSAENAACDKGDFNFEGIGLPQDLAAKYVCKCITKRTINGNICMDCRLRLPLNPEGLDPLPYSRVSPQDFGDAKLNALHVTVRETDHAWREAMAKRSADAEIRALVQLYIDAVYAFQKAKYGKVRVKLSVPRLMG